MKNHDEIIGGLRFDAENVNDFIRYFNAKIRENGFVTVSDILEYLIEECHRTELKICWTDWMYGWMKNIDTRNFAVVMGPMNFYFDLKLEEPMKLD
jgi:hypothetical protein